MVSSLGLSPGRIRLYSASFALLGLLAFRAAPGDWRVFLYGAQHLGSQSLFNPPDISLSFLYPPAFGYLLAPFALLPLALSYAAIVVAMLICAWVGASLLARYYSASQGLAYALVFAWCPTLNAAAIGQNSSFGLLCILASLGGMLRNSMLGTALPLGLLLYKPTYAAPFLILLLVRWRWRELLVVSAMGALWYLASVPAAGTTNWLPLWVHLLHGIYAPDFAFNADKAMGVVALLLRFGVPWPVVALLASCMGAIALPVLRRADPRVAYALAGLLVLNLNSHIWSYDAVLALPAIFWAASTVPSRIRIPVMLVAYVGGVSSLIIGITHLNGLLLPVIGGMVAAIVLHWLPARRPDDVARRNAPTASPASTLYIVDANLAKPNRVWAHRDIYVDNHVDNSPPQALDIR